MPHPADRFHTELHNYFEAAACDLRDLKVVVSSDRQQAAIEVRRQLNLAINRMFKQREELAEAKQQARNWQEIEKVLTEETILAWKARRDLVKLQDRADRTEAFAAAMLVLAKHAIDEAEEATLEAWLARYDVHIARTAA